MILSKIIRQKPYEKIEYLLHRHAFTFVPKAFLFLAMMAMPVGLYFLLENIYPELLNSEKIFPLAVLAASSYYLSIYLFAYAQFVEFYLDMWVVTNDRIIDIRQKGLFARTVSEMDLYRIQDTTASIKGFFPTMFNYGNLQVRTAATGDTNDIIFYNIPDPNELRESLIQLAESDRKFHHNE